MKFWNGFCRILILKFLAFGWELEEGKFGYVLVMFLILVLYFMIRVYLFMINLVELFWKLILNKGMFGVGKIF